MTWEVKILCWRKIRNFQHFLPSFQDLKQYAGWYNSQLADGLTYNMLGWKQIARKLFEPEFTGLQFWIAFLHKIIVTFSRRFPKFLCCSANISKLGYTIGKKIVLISPGYCYRDIFQSLSWFFYVSCCRMAKYTLKISRCSHRKIFKVCLTILQHYAWKG